MEKQNLYAIVKMDGVRGGSWYMMNDKDYKTKKAFMEDLKMNGFKVRKIYTEKQYKELDGK